MKQRTSLALVAALGCLVVGAARADEKKPVSRVETETISATVEAIDLTNRTLTLKGPEGNLVTLDVPKSVERFSAIKVGDVLTARYQEGVVLRVQKPGEAPAAPGTESVTKRPGEKPGATIAEQYTGTVLVQALDPAAQSVTVKTEEGNVVSLRVEDPKYIEGLKVGDKVAITYTRSLALMIDPPKK